MHNLSILCLYWATLIEPPQAAKKVEPCRVWWPVSSPSCSQSTWRYNCTTMEIQSRDGLRWVAATLPSLPRWPAYRWMNQRTNFKHIWIKDTSLVDGGMKGRMQTSVWPNVSTIVIQYLWSCICVCVSVSESGNAVKLHITVSGHFMCVITAVKALYSKTTNTMHFSDSDKCCWVCC